MKPATARLPWQRKIRARPFRPGERPGGHDLPDPAWLAQVRRALPPGGGHLDLGCGEGRLTFALADLWRRGGWSVGLDRDEEALSAARARAAREGLAAARFLSMDIERGRYADALAGRAPDLVTAHLCMGAAIAARAAEVLPPGGTFAFVTLHPDQWKESGRPSRFALRLAEVEALLDDLGLEPGFLCLRKEILGFASPEEALDGFLRPRRLRKGEPVPRWRQAERLEGLRAYFRGGGRTLTTRAHVQCICRKAPR